MDLAVTQAAAATARERANPALATIQLVDQPIKMGQEALQAARGPEVPGGRKALRTALTVEPTAEATALDLQVESARKKTKNYLR